MLIGSALVDATWGGNREELKFVEAEDHAPLTIGSGLTDGHEEVGEVQGKSRGEVPAELGVVMLADFELHDHSVGLQRFRPKLAEQHGFADSAQAGNDH